MKLSFLIALILLFLACLCSFSRGETSDEGKEDFLNLDNNAHKTSPSYQKSDAGMQDEDDVHEAARRERIASLKKQMYESGRLRHDVRGQPHLPIVVSRIGRPGRKSNTTDTVRRTKRGVGCDDCARPNNSDHCMFDLSAPQCTSFQLVEACITITTDPITLCQSIRVTCTGYGWIGLSTDVIDDTGAIYEAEVGSDSSDDDTTELSVSFEADCDTAGWGISDPYVGGTTIFACEGIWGEWVQSTPCNDACGKCGSLTQTRKCLSLQYGCNCTGVDTQSIACGDALCTFPKSTCCKGFSKASVNGKFTCVNSTTPAPFSPEQTTCCDPEGEGLWNQWSSWADCGAPNCGLCGTQTRNRTCASAPYGCPCDMSLATESQACGLMACNTTDKCCPPATIAKTAIGEEFCSLIPQCVGNFSDWVTQSNATCNDTCGMCGRIPQRRTCLPAGCQCDGPYAQNNPCGSALCAFPRKTCCPPATKVIDGASFVCAMP